jgi:uncharacterized membrane protein YcfT
MDFTFILHKQIFIVTQAFNGQDGVAIEATFGTDTELLLYVLLIYFICFILGLLWALFSRKDYNDKEL